MKHVDYLYFNIYNYFYRLSQYRQSVNPRIQTMYLFALGSGGWLLMLESVYLHFIKHSRFTSRAESTLFAGAIYLLTAVLSNYIFIIKDRDLKIFGKYESLSDQHPKRSLHLAISVIVLSVPYIALACFAILLPRH